MSVNAVPLGLAEVPADANAVAIYALDKNGVWLPALTMRIDLEDISQDNWERPLKLAVGGGRYILAE